MQEVRLFYLFHAFVSHPHSVSTPWDLVNAFTARRYASAVYAVIVCLFIFGARRAVSLHCGANGLGCCTCFLEH